MTALGRATRRTLLRGVTGGVAVPLVSFAAPPAISLGVSTACRPVRDRLQVLVVWSGTELNVFRRAVADFEEQQNVKVDLVSAGDGIGAMLSSRIAAGHPPDVAVLPNPGLVWDLQSSLERLQVRDGPATGELGRQRLHNKRGARYGVWLKATHKSLFWYRGDVFRGSPPETLSELVRELKGLAREGRRPLSVGAADGWVLTDWFENTLLAVHPDTYDALAAGARGCWDSPYVTTALTWLGRIWSIPGVLADGPERALLTQYDAAALRTFVRHRGDAALTFGGDYTELLLGPYQKEGAAPARLGRFRFPSADPSRRKPLVVGGDAVVLPRQPESGVRESARGLVKFLAGSEAARKLAKGGFLSLHDAASGKLAEQVRDDDARYDLADLLSGELARGDGQGLSGILQDFFSEVAETGDGAVQAAVVRAQRQMIEAAGWS